VTSDPTALTTPEKSHPRVCGRSELPPIATKKPWLAITISEMSWIPDPTRVDCLSRQLLDLIADKWSVFVLSVIADGVTRNGAILRAIGHIAEVDALRPSCRGGGRGLQQIVRTVS
jgi:hypothetical protein